MRAQTGVDFKEIRNCDPPNDSRMCLIHGDGSQNAISDDGFASSHRTVKHLTTGGDLAGDVRFKDYNEARNETQNAINAATGRFQISPFGSFVSRATAALGVNNPVNKTTGVGVDNSSVNKQDNDLTNERYKTMRDKADASAKRNAEVAKQLAN